MVTTALITLLLIALLAVPLTLRFRLNRYKTIEGEATLQWLFGLVNITLSKPQPHHEAKKQERARDKKVSSQLKLTRALRQKAFRDRILKYVADIWRAIRKEDFRLYLRLGLGDPADTGQLWAIIGPLSGILFTLEDAEVEIEPDFIESTFELVSQGNIRIIPLQLITLTLGIIFSPTIWRGIIEARGGHHALNGNMAG
jgi:hypothetical protein